MKAVLLLIALCYSIGNIAQIPNSKIHTDAILDAWDNSNTPGIATAILKDGKVIYLKGFGIANLQTKKAVTPQTKFQLGELSKQFTTMAILLLEEQGIITLNDDIRKYLPELPEYKHIVTISHLLNHSSGLHGINQINNMVYGTTNILNQAKAIELIAAQKTLSFKPGTNFSHHESTTESVLMAEIVARSSDKSFADYVKSNIFEPLGMHNSLIRDDYNMLLTDIAEPYRKEEGGDFKKHEVRSSVVGAINAYCSAEDLAKWYLNYTNPQGNLGRLVQSLDTPVQLTNGKKFNYYWGDMAIGREFTHPERGLPIFWNFGLQGGYGTNVFRYLDQKITSFALGNSDQYNGSLAMAAIDTLVNNLYQLPAEIDYKALKTVKLNTKKLKVFEGNYWFKKGYATKLFVENDTLRNQWLFGTRSNKLLPVSENTFQQMGSNEDVRLYKFIKDGDDMTLYFTYNDSEADIMRRYTPADPSEPSRQDYVGTYINDDYSILFSFYLQDGKLIARNLDHQAIKFRSVKKDVFTSTSIFFNSLEFYRDQSKGIKGFTIDTDGIQNLSFEKVK